MDDSDYSYNEIMNRMQENYKRQAILTENNNLLEKILFKKANKETLSKVLSTVLNFYFNNQNYINSQFEKDFYINIRKVMLKYKRSEINNTLPIYIKIIKNLRKDIDSYHDSNNKLIETINFNSIYIRVILRLEADVLKLKFTIKDEILNNYNSNNNNLNENFHQANFEKGLLINKIIKNLISNELRNEEFSQVYEIRYDDVQRIMTCISKSSTCVKKPEQDHFDFLDINDAGDLKIMKCQKFEIDRIKKECLIFLEKHVNNHIKLFKRNTFNLKKTFDSFQKFIENQKANNLILSSNIVDILPFGSFTQFSFTKQSDLEITITTKFLNDFHEYDEEKISLAMNLKEKNTIKNNVINFNINNDSEDRNETGDTNKNNKFYDIVRKRAEFIYELYNTIAESKNYFDVQSNYTQRAHIINFYDKETLVKIELIIDNILALYNANLIRNYCLYDSRIIILINFIKDWSKINKVNGNFNGYLSSYCFTIMVIYFLQKINPHVLPVLQSKNFNNFEDILFYEDISNKNKRNKPSVSIRHLFCNFQMKFDLNSLKKWNNSNFNNKMSVAELIYNFFKFYLFIFDENNYCIDIQNQEFFYRFFKHSNNYEEKSQYVIIDPIDYGYNPARYLEKNSLQAKTLKKEFWQALQNIANCRNLINLNNDLN